MGIPSCRFVDRHHDQFTCTICLDVASNPVAVTDCDHIFCLACIDSDQFEKCPTCQSAFKETKWSGLKGTLKRIYYDLNMKCLNPSCDQPLTTSNYEDHDENCPITFNVCEDCGFKVRRAEGTEHSCVRVLKDELAEMKEKFESELEKTGKKLEGELGKIEKKIEEERKRSDDLLLFCMMFRNSFYYVTSGPESYSASDLKTHQNYTSHRFEKVKKAMERAKEEGS